MNRQLQHFAECLRRFVYSRNYVTAVEAAKARGIHLLRAGEALGDDDVISIPVRVRDLRAAEQLIAAVDKVKGSS